MLCKYRSLSTLILTICFVSYLPLQDASSSEPLRVISAKVDRQPIADRVEALGTLSANESVVLSANITERIEQILFQDGQVVEKDAVLVEFRNAEEQALLEEALSRRRESKRQYERLQPLQEGGAAPSSLIDERLREYETAKAQVSLLEARLENRKIVAPFGGILGLRDISRGALVSPGDPVVTLDDISVMKLDFSIPSIFLQSIEIGQRIVATARAFPDMEFAGEVSSIGSRVDPVTRSVTVRALIPNPTLTLRPGLLMVVNLFRNEREAIVIPEEGIIAEEGKKFVFVIDQEASRLSKREVTTGAREPGTVEILSGLEVGELIVAHGTIRARDGIPVRIAGDIDQGDSVREIISSSNRETP